MAGVFSVLFLLGYLVFLVDWKELRGVLAQGGWGTAVIYGVVTVLIVSVLSNPATIGAPAVHH
jgi:hypothetical protein